MRTRTRARSRRALSVLAAAALVLSGTLAAGTAAQALPPGIDSIPQKATMAALGDSITQAAATCDALFRCGENSWSTGTTSSVESHAARLRDYVPELTAYNDAVSGAASDELAAQARKAVAQGAQYVTLAIGANDACTDYVSQMTSVSAFRANVGAALAVLEDSPAAPQIFVASIPSLKRVYELGRTNPKAIVTWGKIGVCPTMLANPLSIRYSDIQRRAVVQQRVDAYNRALADACAATRNCRYDGGAVAGYDFTRSQISTRDYFHPSLAGQATMAEVTWLATQWVS